MFDKYIGIPYDLTNQHGLNCWALVALVYHDKGLTIPHYASKNHQQVTAAFTAAFAEGLHGFYQVDEPIDFDVVIMKAKRLTHCGVWYQGRILHANNGAKQVTFERLKDVARPFKSIEFWRK